MGSRGRGRESPANLAAGLAPARAKAMVRPMKIAAALLGMVILSAGLQAQTPAAPAPAAPAPVAPATPGATKSDPKAKPKEEKMGKVEGIALTRPNGLSLGLTLVEGKFKLTFYDKMKKPTKVDVTRALARWPNVHGPGDNRTVLNPAGDGTYLLGLQFVRGPYSFKLFITLMKGEGDSAEAVENYTVDFRG
jgi:hypothetical protein